MAIILLCPSLGTADRELSSLQENKEAVATASAIRQGLEYIMCVVCLICNDEPLLKSGIRTQKKAKDLQMPETYSVICHSIIFNKQK